MPPDPTLEAERDAEEQATAGRRSPPAGAIPAPPIPIAEPESWEALAEGTTGPHERETQPEMPALRLQRAAHAGRIAELEHRLKEANAEVDAMRMEVNAAARAIRNAQGVRLEALAPEPDRDVVRDALEAMRATDQLLVQSEARAADAMRRAESAELEASRVGEDARSELAAVQAALESAEARALQAEARIREAEADRDSAWTRVSELEALFQAFAEDHERAAKASKARTLELILERDRAVARAAELTRELEDARAALTAARPAPGKRSLFEEAIDAVMFGRTREGMETLKELLCMEPDNAEYRAWLAQAESFLSSEPLPSPEPADS